MAAAYPASVKSFSTLNTGDTVQTTDVSANYDELVALETALLTNGLAHTLKFVDATYDIGGSVSTYRPRDLWLSRNASIGGTLGVTGATTLSAALGGTAATFSATLGVTGKATLANSVISLRGVDYTLPAADAAGQLTSNGSGTLTWTAASAGLPGAAYAATLANVLNTASQTTWLSFSVPSMADGDVIEIVFSALKKNNKGTSGTITLDVFYGAATVTSFSGVSWSNSATEFKDVGVLYLQRVGSDLWVLGGSAGQTPFSGYGDGVTNVVVVSAPTFGSAQTVSLKMTLSAADATFYWKPQSALVHHRKVS